jgi:hypothetical protein
LDDSTASVEELTHDLTQALGIDNCGQGHRPYDVGEQDRYLFVFSLRSDCRDGGSAGIAKAGAGARLGTAIPAG